jgi:membrane protein
MRKIERIIYSSPPIAFIIRKSKHISIPGFQKIPLYDVTRFFFQQIKKVGLNERAAAISFNLIMALPAALLFLFSVIPYFPDAQNFQKQILTLFKDLTPNSNTYTLIQNLLNDLFKKHVGVFSSGFILVMFYSSNAMMGIIRTFDKSIQETKIFIFHRRLRAMRLTLILILLVIASALVLIGQEQLEILLKELFLMKRRARIPWWSGIRWFIITGIFFCGIALIYKYAPSVKKRWNLLSPGSILSTVMMLSATILFSYWVNNFASYNKVYGSIGTVLILMLLIYFNSLILLIGFELNVSITYLKAEVEKRQQKELEEVEKK